MNLNKLVLAAALSAASSVTIAGGFDGPFVQAGIGFANSQTDGGYNERFGEDGGWGFSSKELSNNNLNK
jgi:hypothetical protein